jgi:hypothetical protein
VCSRSLLYVDTKYLRTRTCILYALMHKLMHLTNTKTLYALIVGEERSCDPLQTCHSALFPVSFPFVTLTTTYIEVSTIRPFVELEQSADHSLNMRTQTTDGHTIGEDIGIWMQYSGTGPLLSPSARIMILRFFVMPAIVMQYWEHFIGHPA